MTPASARAAVTLLVLLGFSAGCSYGNSHGVPAATPQRSPSEEPSSVEDPIARLMQAKTPGLSITRTQSGSIAVQVVQGQTSFYGSSEPLFLVDDVPYRPGAGGELIGINPYDIDSITLLRRPEEISMYGVRGANGVVVIKMKKAGKSSD